MVHLLFQSLNLYLFVYDLDLGLLDLLSGRQRVEFIGLVVLVICGVELPKVDPILVQFLVSLLYFELLLKHLSFLLLAIRLLFKIRLGLLNLHLGVVFEVLFNDRTFVLPGNLVIRYGFVHGDQFLIGEWKLLFLQFEVPVRLLALYLFVLYYLLYLFFLFVLCLILGPQITLCRVKSVEFLHGGLHSRAFLLFFFPVFYLDVDVLLGLHGVLAL